MVNYGRFENNKNQNNCYINSVLHIYLRIEDMLEGIYTILKEEKGSKSFPTNLALGKSQSQSLVELLKVIQRAIVYREEKSVPMDKFRKTLGIDYPHTFKKNQAGDAQTFLSWLHQIFTKDADISSIMSNLIEDNFKMEYQRFWIEEDDAWDLERECFSLLM